MTGLSENIQHFERSGSVSPHGRQMDSQKLDLLRRESELVQLKKQLIELNNQKRELQSQNQENQVLLTSCEMPKFLMSNETARANYFSVQFSPNNRYPQSTRVSPFQKQQPTIETQNKVVQFINVKAKPSATPTYSSTSSKPYGISGVQPSKSSRENSSPAGAKFNFDRIEKRNSVHSY